MMYPQIDYSWLLCKVLGHDEEVEAVNIMGNQAFLFRCGRCGEVFWGIDAVAVEEINKLIKSLHLAMQ